MEEFIAGSLTFAVIYGALFFSAVMSLLPTVIALFRGHHNVGAIAVLNLFLGWTFLGWIGALVWSFTATGEK